MVFLAMRAEQLRPLLIQACKDNDARRVAYLLRSGADPNSRDTPKKDNDLFSVIKRMISLRRDQNKDHEFPTALMLASRGLDSSSTLVLLKNGARVNDTGSIGNTALMDAAREGQPSTVNILIDAKAKIDAQNDDKRTALMHAALFRRGTSGKLLLDRGADLTLRDTAGDTAISLAAENGAWDMIEPLLQHHADPNSKTSSGQYVLGIAVRVKKVESVEHLLAAGADPNVQDISDPILIQAIEASTMPIVRSLLDHGGNPNLKHHEGRPAILFAMELNKINAVIALLDHKVDREASFAGLTVLHTAVRRRNAKLVDLLIRAGCSPRAVDESGATPLAVARGYGDAAVARALMSRQAPIEVAIQAIPVSPN
jgi:ankyrin repeat protein